MGAQHHSYILCYDSWDLHNVYSHCVAYSPVTRAYYARTERLYLFPTNYHQPGQHLKRYHVHRLYLYHLLRLLQCLLRRHSITRIGIVLWRSEGPLDIPWSRFCDHWIATFLIIVPLQPAQISFRRRAVSYGRQATIDVNHAVMRILVLRQEQRCRSDFFGLAQAPERDARRQRSVVQSCMYIS